MSILINKQKSFTLSELLVVLVITSIVVGIAFSVLNLVQKQINKGHAFFEDTTALGLFEHQLTYDFNTTNSVYFDSKSSRLLLKKADSEINYTLETTHALRNNATLAVQLQIKEVYYEGLEVNSSGVCDAVLLEAIHIPNYVIFVTADNDATYYMNQDGF